TLKAPLPIAQMSSSTFSRSLTKLPVTSRPSLSTHSVRKRSLLGPPIATCWMPRTLKGRALLIGSSLEADDDLVDRQALALVGHHLVDHAVLRREQDVLHLHRLDDGQLLASPHGLSRLHRHIDQQARHRRQQELREIRRRL